MIRRGTAAALAVVAALALVRPVDARADIVLSELIVELQPGKHAREDVEIWNNGSERAYVAVVPGEIVNAGRAGQARREIPDPEKLGLLVAPARMILEPGQRKLLRIASLAPDAGQERVYRVTVKPVAGPLASSETGLKVLVGYDVLVLVRPNALHPNVTATRSGNSLLIHNGGNVSVELTDGHQCDVAGQHCVDLPRKRLYAGADWTQVLKRTGPVDYLVKSPKAAVRTRF
jgi:P pilus assembly chaperone PapD